MQPPPYEVEFRPVTRVDLDDLDALLDAIESTDEPSERHTRAELYDTFDALGPDAGQECLLGRHPDGTLVAYGWNHPFPTDTDPRRVHATGGVHPDWRRSGIGRTVLTWQLEQARLWYDRTWVDGYGPLQVVAYAGEQQVGLRRLYEEIGLSPVRWYADMTLRFAGPPPVHRDPAGIRIVPMSRKRIEAVRIAHNEVFADHWGTSPVDAEGWEQQLLRPESRLSWSWVALDAETSELVGYATNAAHEGDWAAQGFSEGWTDRLGVRRPWRERGVARALLTASMRSFLEAGLDGAGLGVDSDDPCRAFELYQELGYHSSHTVVMYAKTDETAPTG